MNKLNYKSILIAFVFLCIGSFLSKAESSLNALSDIKGVEYIYISESILNSMGGKAPVEMLSAISDVANVPIIASGGAGCMEHFKQLFNAVPGVDAGLAASIFHFKQVEINDLKQYLINNGIEMRI